MDSREKNYYRKIRLYFDSLPADLLFKPDLEHKVDHHSDDILPFELYRGIPSNLELIAEQINKSFYYGIYDGCAVLMRRLVEMLLILSFKRYGIEKEIRGADGKYLQLSGIVRAAEKNEALDLTRNAKENLGLFVEKGHLSAHNPFFNARRRDIELTQLKFRQLVEELLYKSNILK